MPTYMQYPGVEGTGKGNHKGWIELDSVQLGTFRNVQDPTSHAINREAAAPAMSEIVVTKTQDIASSGLLREFLNGKGQQVVIHFVAKDSKNEVPYLSIEMENTLISGFNVSGHGGTSHDRPMESLSLNFTKVTYASTPVEASKDPKDRASRATWDLATGQMTTR